MSCEELAAGDAGEDVVGRLRIRRTGWKAAGGGETTALPLVLDPVKTSSGIGARLLLSIGDASSRSRYSLMQRLTLPPTASAGLPQLDLPLPRHPSRL